jgi:hypothetical protein
MCESFFATLECELLDRRRFKTQAEARIAVFEFIEGFYNPRRRHSSIGYLSPIDYERHAERLGTALVVAFEQRPNPARRERQDLGDLFNLISARQQPQCMKMALGDWIGRRLIASSSSLLLKCPTMVV